MNSNSGLNKDHYFWRTYDGQEIDLIEASVDKISAYEFKWGESSGKAPGAFSGAYPDADYQIINRGNYLKFVL